MDRERVKALLADSITVLCKSGIQYKTTFTVQGLLGITVDNEDVFLVDIHERVGDSRLPAGTIDKYGCKGTGSKFICTKRRRERKLFRPKRKRPDSDSFQIPSPSLWGLDMSHGQGRAKQDQSEPMPSVIGEHLEAVDSEDERKETSSSASAIADTCSLEMTVDQILDHAKDVCQWSRKDEHSNININPGSVPGVRSAESTAVHSNSLSKNLMMKNEDNIVHVKQEKNNVLEAICESEHQTQIATETYSQGPSSQGQIIDSQSGFTIQSKELLQDPETYPAASDLSLTPHTDGSSGSEVDLFQTSDQTKTSEHGGEASMSTPTNQSDEAHMKEESRKLDIKRKTETITRSMIQYVKKACTKGPGNTPRRDDVQELPRAPRRFLNTCRTRHIAARAVANAKTRADIRLQNDIRKILAILEQRNVTDPLNIPQRLFDASSGQYSHVDPSDINAGSNVKVASAAMGDCSHLSAGVSDNTSDDLRVHIPSFVPDIGPFITEKITESSSYGLTPETTRRLFASAKSITHFAVLLARKVFTDEDLENANIRGWGGKRKLDTSKVNAIKTEVFNWYMTSSYNQEEVWNREIIKAIDKDNRKRRSAPKQL